MREFCLPCDPASAYGACLRESVDAAGIAIDCALCGEGECTDAPADGGPP